MKSAKFNIPIGKNF